MILNILFHVLSFVAGALFSYFFLKANPKKAAAVDKAIVAVDETASAVSAIVTAASKKL